MQHLVQNKEYSLSQLHSKIKAGTYRIPHFQRKFVWSTVDVTKLGDTLIRGFPMGNLLLMEIDEGILNLNARTLSTSAVLEESSKTDSFYVLDGQQRLTSIAEIFGLSDQEYYFDTLAILLSEFEKDLSRSTVFQDMLKKGTEVDTEQFCCSFKSSKKSCDSREEFRFISARVVLEERATTMLINFVSSFKDIEESTRNHWLNRLSAIFHSLVSYRIPVSELSPNAGLSTIIRIFETINATGCSLSPYDLIHAKSFQVKDDTWKCGITKFLTDSITLKLKSETYDKESVEKFFGVTKNDNDESEFSELVRILKCAAYAEDYIASYNTLTKNFERAYPSVSSILSKNPEDWFLQWGRHSDTLLKIISKIGREGLLDFGNMSFIEPIIGIVLAHPEMADDLIFLKAIKRKVLFYAISSQSTFRRSDLGVLKDFTDLAIHLKGAHGMTRHLNQKVFSDMVHIQLSDQDFESSSMKSGRSRALLYILYSEHHQNIGLTDLSGERVNSITSKDTDFHHIFPKSTTKLATSQKLLNSVANAAILNKKSNRNEIKDKLPSVYLNEIRANYPNSADSYEKNNLLEGFASSSSETMEELLRNRLSCMLNIAKDYFQR
jgi:hypothetical protein